MLAIWAHTEQKPQESSDQRHDVQHGYDLWRLIKHSACDATILAIQHKSL